ncbi:hypothetical protein ACC704_37485, partial [Rhizobium johnstonii]
MFRRCSDPWRDCSEAASEEVSASGIVGAITPKVEEAEIERAKRKTTESLDAYDYYLRGLAAFDRTVTN